MKIGLFILLFLTFSQAFAQQSQSSAQYQRIDNMKHQIHVLEIDPNKHRIVPFKEDPHMRKSVSALVKQYKAYAGINGGFFHETGMPAGALKVNGKWMGFSKQPRGAIGWNEKDNQVLIDRIITKADTKNNNFITVSPQLDTSPASKKCWQEFDYIVGGAPLLIKDGVVIQDYLPEKMVASFTEKRHARTGICIKKNHNWIFVVVTHTYEADRNHSNIDAEGFSIREFAHLMKEMECIDAINLDGGYSSTLVIDNKVINTPAGQWNGITQAFEEQAVGDAILIFKR